MNKLHKRLKQSIVLGARKKLKRTVKYLKSRIVPVPQGFLRHQSVVIIGRNERNSSAIQLCRSALQLSDSALFLKVIRRTIDILILTDLHDYTSTDTAMSGKTYVGYCTIG